MCFFGVSSNILRYYKGNVQTTVPNYSLIFYSDISCRINHYIQQQQLLQVLKNRKSNRMIYNLTSAKSEDLLTHEKGDTRVLKFSQHKICSL